MKKTTGLSHQGDVIIKPYEGDFKGMKKLEHKGSFVLKHGESGNSQRLQVKNPAGFEIYQDSFGNYFFQVKEKATLVHEEHKTHTFAPAKYKMEHEQEFDYFQKAVVRSMD